MYGQPYWHRVHQLPGVWICPTHNEPLSFVDTDTVQLKRHRLLLPDDALVLSHTWRSKLSDFQFETALRIARLSECALLGAFPASVSADWQSVHRDNAAHCMLTTSNGRIRVMDLVQCLEKYAIGLPSTNEYLILRRRINDWPLKLLRKPKGNAQHPLKHIILLDCLRLDSSNSLRVDQEAVLTPPTNGHHKTRQAIDRGRLVQLIEVEKQSLSTVARILELSVTTVAIEAARAGLTVATRPKRITPALRGVVRSSLLEGRTLHEAASHHGISLSSVYRILRMDPELEKAYKDKRFQICREGYRSGFVGRHSSPDAYAWLRRHDGQWLANQQAPKANLNARGPSVNWAQRDKQFAQCIIEAEAAAHQAVGRPRRISRSLLERATKMAETIERNLGSLPLTRSALIACSETAPACQRRRIVWAASELGNEFGGLLPRWLLLRQAGIRKLAVENEELVHSLTSSGALL